MTFLLDENGWMPNNPRLPVIFYTRVAEDPADLDADGMEELFQRNEWKPQWRDGVYAYHHYHSTAHETLGVVRGSARLMLGGPHGSEIKVRPGQVLIIPAGVGHRRLEADEDFLVVGAYPAGQDWDLCKDAAKDATRKRIAHLPIPASDPVAGRDGLLTRLWRH